METKSEPADKTETEKISENDQEVGEATEIKIESRHDRILREAYEDYQYQYEVAENSREQEWRQGWGISDGFGGWAEPDFQACDSECGYCGKCDY